MPNTSKTAQQAHLLPFCYYYYYAGRKQKNILTLILDLPDLFHRLLEDGTFVRLDVEVVHVVDVGKDQLCQFLDVFVLLLPVSPLSAPLRAGEQEGEQRQRQKSPNHDH